MSFFHPQGGGVDCTIFISRGGGRLQGSGRKALTGIPGQNLFFTRGSLGGGPRPKGGTPTPKKSGLEGPETQNFLLLLVYILVYTSIVSNYFTN